MCRAETGLRSRVRCMSIRKGRDLMPSIERPLSGDVMVYTLDDERRRTEEPAAVQRHKPSARTLLKDGPLRVTLIVLGAAGVIAEHSAEGPITVHVLDGDVRFTVAGETHELRAGHLLSVRAGVRHHVGSENGGSFLLTVALPV